MITYKYIFTFGKHKGKTVKEIMFEDPSYLLWADDNVEGFQLSDYLRDKAEQMDNEFRDAEWEENLYELLNDNWGDRD